MVAYGVMYNTSSSTYRIGVFESRRGRRTNKERESEKGRKEGRKKALRKMWAGLENENSRLRPVMSPWAIIFLPANLDVKSKAV